VRAVLDSNVWLAILTTDGFCRRMWRETRQTSKFISSRDILDEVKEKLVARFGFSPRYARLMTFFVERQTQFVPVTSIVSVCRDVDDNCILAAASDSGCSYLVTGDSDLLELKKFQGIGIVTPREFLELISKA
jgi:putative PIN family toxin of toxin-antitoxin system